MAKKLRCRLPELVAEYNKKLSRKKRKNGERKLTQRGLARQTGITLSTIHKIFKGTSTRIDYLTIERLCEFFNCGVADLFTLEEIDEQSPAPQE